MILQVAKRIANIRFDLNGDGEKWFSSYPDRGYNNERIRWNTPFL